MAVSNRSPHRRPEMRRRVGGQLNKGENLNGLRETVNFAHGGAIRHRQLVDQVPQALCLTLVVNCIAAFNAGLLPSAVEALRAAGFEVGDADVAHVGPTVNRAHLGPRSLLLRPRPPPEGPQAGPGASPGAPAPAAHGQQALDQGAEGLSVDLRRCSSDGCVGF